MPKGDGVLEQEAGEKYCNLASKRSLQNLPWPQLLGDHLRCTQRRLSQRPRAWIVEYSMAANQQKTFVREVRRCVKGESPYDNGLAGGSQCRQDGANR